MLKIERLSELIGDTFEVTLSKEASILSVAALDGLTLNDTRLSMQNYMHFDVITNKKGSKTKPPIPKYRSHVIRDTETVSCELVDAFLTPHVIFAVDDVPCHDSLITYRQATPNIFDAFKKDALSLAKKPINETVVDIRFRFRLDNDVIEATAQKVNSLIYPVDLAYYKAGVVNGFYIDAESAYSHYKSQFEEDKPFVFATQQSAQNIDSCIHEIKYSESNLSADLMITKSDKVTFLTVATTEPLPLDVFKHCYSKGIRVPRPLFSGDCCDVQLKYRALEEITQAYQAVKGEAVEDGLLQYMAELLYRSAVTIALTAGPGQGEHHEKVDEAYGMVLLNFLNTKERSIQFLEDSYNQREFKL